MNSQHLYFHFSAIFGSPEALHASDFSRKLFLNVRRGPNGKMSHCSGEFEGDELAQFPFYLHWYGLGDAETNMTLMMIPLLLATAQQIGLVYLSVMQYLSDNALIDVDMNEVKESMLSEDNGASILQQYERIRAASCLYVDRAEAEQRTRAWGSATAILQRIAARS